MLANKAPQRTFFSLRVKSAGGLGRSPEHKRFWFSQCSEAM